uniref:hypothetical protein n=1 Tax=uncultured Erythrobacter sp. TaxID=263913 RepID=UPI0026194D83|nr:hypothetical protein [uncultured Erythrobacter sp.]
MLTTKRAPESAMSAFGVNGAAYEEAAFDAFSEKVAVDPQDLTGAAGAARALALEALRRDPTTAKALAILALAKPDLSARHGAALAASRLNRRNLTLQGLALEARLANEETTQVIETLDQILRVHPTYSREFYPVLGQALTDPATVPAFIRFLDGSSPWHEAFFTKYALARPELRANLATIRMERPVGDEEFDSRLVSGLAKDGNLSAAQRLFEFLSQDDDAQGEASGQIAWSSDFPPFDWDFTDEGDFRGQASRDGSELELFVRPGQGGVIAERIMAMPDTPFDLSFVHSDASSAQSEDVRIELTCTGETLPFFAQRLSVGENSLAVGSAPDCDQMRLVINARVFSGQTTLRSRISQIEIRQR